MAGARDAVREQILREVSHAIDELDMSQPPPVMGQRIHRIVRRLTGNADPYREVKDRFNRLALELYPALKARVDGSLEAAVRLAIAGNIIDSGPNSHLDEDDVRDGVEYAFAEPLVGSVEGFADAIAAAGSILYLTDNAGEIVFDRLLIELLPTEKVTVAVRGAPVINDATRADAREAGLPDIVEVVDNGSDAPGTLLGDCSEDFRRRFREAGLVISKGQGNYETLSDSRAGVFFLLKVKCPVIARDIGAEVGSMVLRAGSSTAVVERGGG